MEEFERQLREAFERRPAPPGLKRKLMARRRRAVQRQNFSWFAWKGFAASLVSVALCILAALTLYGGYESRQAEQRREGEAARQQVLAALRITGHALNHLNQQLAAHHRAIRE
jgi:hypothetical protein